LLRIATCRVWKIFFPSTNARFLKKRLWKKGNFYPRLLHIFLSPRKLSYSSILGREIERCAACTIECYFCNARNRVRAKETTPFPSPPRFSVSLARVSPTVAHWDVITRSCKLINPSNECLDFLLKYVRINISYLIYSRSDSRSLLSCTQKKISVKSKLIYLN